MLEDCAKIHSVTVVITKIDTHGVWKSDSWILYFDCLGKEIGVDNSSVVNQMLLVWRVIGDLLRVMRRKCIYIEENHWPDSKIIAEVANFYKTGLNWVNWVTNY